LIDTGHRTDRLTDAIARTDEERENELGRLKPGLAHEATKRAGATEAARTVLRKGGHG
jgi:hypothetical protein